MPVKNSEKMIAKYGMDTVTKNAIALECKLREIIQSCNEAVELAKIYNAYNLNKVSTAQSWANKSLNSIHQYNLNDFNIPEDMLNKITYNNPKNLTDTANNMIENSARNILNIIFDNKIYLYGKFINIGFEYNGSFNVTIDDDKCASSYLSIDALDYFDNPCHEFIDIVKNATYHRLDQTYGMMTKILSTLNEYIDKSKKIKGKN